MILQFIFRFSFKQDIFKNKTQPDADGMMAADLNKAFISPRINGSREYVARQGSHLKSKRTLEHGSSVMNVRRRNMFGVFNSVLQPSAPSPPSLWLSPSPPASPPSVGAP